MKKRNCRFEVRFTKDELSDLTKKARKARLTNAAFIRCAVCGAEVREAPPADVPLLIGEVRRVPSMPAASFLWSGWLCCWPPI